MLPTKLKVSLISCAPLPPSIIANSIHQKGLRSSEKHDSLLKTFGRFKSFLRRDGGKRSLYSTSTSFGYTLPDVLRNLMVDARTYDMVFFSCFHWPWSCCSFLRWVLIPRDCASACFKKIYSIQQRSTEWVRRFKRLTSLWDLKPIRGIKLLSRNSSNA